MCMLFPFRKFSIKDIFKHIKSRWNRSENSHVPINQLQRYFHYTDLGSSSPLPLIFVCLFFSILKQISDIVLLFLYYLNFPMMWVLYYILVFYMHYIFKNLGNSIIGHENTIFVAYYIKKTNAVIYKRIKHKLLGINKFLKFLLEIIKTVKWQCLKPHTAILIID